MELNYIHQKLVYLIKLLKELPLKASGEINYQRIHQFTVFMKVTAELYLDVRDNAEALADTEFQNYLKESDYLLKSCMNDINSFLFEIDEALHSNSEFYSTDEWISVCWMRSSIEAVKELYPSNYFEKYSDEIEELDEEIKGKGRIEGFLSAAEIPDKLPSSHWWWWCPDAPPDSQDL